MTPLTTLNAGSTLANMAADAKVAGNECFKVSCFSGALEHYTRGIEAGAPADAEAELVHCTLLSNRAACHLHMGQFSHGVADCKDAANRLDRLCQETRSTGKDVSNTPHSALRHKVIQRLAKLVAKHDSQRERVAACVAAVASAEATTARGDFAAALDHFTAALAALPLCGSGRSGEDGLDDLQTINAGQLYLARGKVHARLCQFASAAADFGAAAQNAGAAAITVQQAEERLAKVSSYIKTHDEPSSDVKEAWQADSSGRCQVETFSFRLVHGCDGGSFVVQCQPILSETGGRMWDSAVILSCWLVQNRQDIVRTSAGSQSLVLEVGAGLGLAGLVSAKLGARAVLTDYCTAVNANLHTNVALSFPKEGGAGADEAALVTVESLDFEDFTPTGHSSGPLGCDPSRIAPYAHRAGKVDIIIGSDVVYSSHHAHLARVCCHLLAPATGRAVFVLPDSREGLRQFKEQLADVGLQCDSEPVASAVMAQARGMMHSGFGENNSYSTHMVTQQGTAPF
jgi:predicted nicotinamide N-methyase